jgi:hypothetical protein
MGLHDSWKWVVLAQLQLNCNELHCIIYKKLQLCNWCNLSNYNHNVEIRWVASGHYNSKIKMQNHLQNHLQNTHFSHNITHQTTYLSLTYLSPTYLHAYMPTHPHMTHLLTYILNHQPIHLLAHSLIHWPCHNPNLGFATKVKAWKDVSQECNSGVTFVLSGMQGNVWRNEPTLTSGFLLWKLEFVSSPKFSKNDFGGQN